MDSLGLQPAWKQTTVSIPPRITAAVDALANNIGPRGCFPRRAGAAPQGEMVAARDTAQAVLLRTAMAGAAPSGCASCRTRSSASSMPPPQNISTVRRALWRRGAWRRLPPAATARLMAPESDIDLCSFLPYKQTAWGEQVRSHSLLLVDMD